MKIWTNLDLTLEVVTNFCSKNCVQSNKVILGKAHPMNMVHAKVKNGSHTCLYFGKIWQTSIPAQEKKCKFNSIFGGKSNLSHVHKPKTTPVQYALKSIIYEDNQPGGMGIINQSSLMKTFFFSLLLPFMYFKTWPAALYYTENVNPRRPLHNMN